MLSFETLKAGDKLYRWLEFEAVAYDLLCVNPLAELAVCRYELGDSKIIGPVSKSLLQQFHRTPPRKPLDALHRTTA